MTPQHKKIDKSEIGIIRGAIKERGDILHSIDKKVLETLGYDPSIFGLHCPLGFNTCAKVQEIANESSNQNVFIAIPYSSYAYEESIIEVVNRAGLTHKLAKDKIDNSTLLCKVCKTIRICSCGVFDFSNSNLNVIYELGLAQSLGKQVAILKPKTVPTDLLGLEYLNHDESTYSVKILIGEWLIEISSRLRRNAPKIKSTELRQYLNSLSSRKLLIPTALNKQSNKLRK